MSLSAADIVFMMHPSILGKDVPVVRKHIFEWKNKLL